LPAGELELASQPHWPPAGQIVPRRSSSPSLGAAGAAKCGEGGGVRRTSYKLGEEGSCRCRQEPRVRAPRGPVAELHCFTELGRGGPPSEEGRRFAPAASQFQPGGPLTGPEVLQIWPHCARTRRPTLEPPSTSQR
jgi:hypothetical protein